MAIASNVPMAPANERRLRDYNYIANVAGPAAGATANTAALDFIQPQWQSGQNAPATGPTGPYAITERIWINVSVTSGGATANNKNLNIVLQHTGALADGSVDTGNYANITALGNPVLKGVDQNAAGLAANSINLMLPPDVKRFVRAQGALEANGGNAANATISLQAYF